MSEQEVIAKLQEIFRQVFDDSSIVIGPETSAEDIDDWDSIMHIQLIIAVEKNFGVKLTTSQLAQLHGVGDLVSVLTNT